MDVTGSSSAALQTAVLCETAGLVSSGLPNKARAARSTLAASLSSTREAAIRRWKGGFAIKSTGFGPKTRPGDPCLLISPDGALAFDRGGIRGWLRRPADP